MAEIRIPTDQIPLDILHRLQAMIPSFRPSSPQTHASVNHYQNQFHGYSAPSTRSSPTQCTPTFEQSLTAAAPSVTPQTYARSRGGSSWTTQNKPKPAASDEVDGDDTVVHAFHIQTPATRVTNEVLDDSDIVRIFPKVGEVKRTTTHSGSDVVRIFESGPDGEKRLADTTGIVRIDHESAKMESRETPKSDIVRVLSPVSSGQSSVARANSKSDLTQQCNATDSRTDAAEAHFRFTRNSSSWGDVAASQHDRASSLPFTGSRKHSGSVMPSSADFSDRRANTPEPRVGVQGKGSSHNFYSLQSAMSHMSREAMSEQDGVRPRHGYSETCSTAQTVDDAEVEDDEVFSLDVGSKQPGFDAHKLCQHDATNQHIFETTPTRDLILPRLNPEICEPIKNRLSPFSPALMLSEMSFGDRQNTRKRLSFEEGEASPPKSQFKFPPCIAQQSFQGITFSSAASTPSSSTNSSVSNKSLSPFLTSQKHVFTYPYRQCSSPDREISTGGISSSNDICQKPSEKSSSSSCRSPVSEIMQALEQVSSQHVQGSGAPRGRVRSDGDEDTLDGRSQGQGHPQQPRPRGQTFSHSKRRRKNSSYSGDDEGSSFSSQESLTQSRDQAEEACGDCQCSMIKKYVLQMAENAYKRIRKMDGSVEDFERFRTELATTNNLLRESIANIYSFKTICPHKSRSSSSSSSSSLQSSSRPC